jgi:uncharacterized protein
VDQAVRNIAVAAHLSTFAGLVVPFGSVIGPLAVWLTRRDPDPFIDQAGREALNFGISIAIYGLVALVATLMLVGIPLLIVGAIAWVVLASLAAVKASHGQAYGYPPTMRLVRSSDQAQGERPTEAGSPWLVPRSASSPPLGTPPR